MFVLCAISAVAQAAPPSTRPVTVDRLLSITSARDLLELSNDKAAELVSLLERVVDEKSARELGRDIEKVHLELALISARVATLLPETAEKMAQITALNSAYIDVNNRLKEQRQRLLKSPAIAAELGPVLRPLHDGDGSRAGSVIPMLQTVRGQVELYNLQHSNKPPDFRALGWQALTRKTNQDGRIDNAGAFGPYLSIPPINPLTSSSAIVVVKGQPKHGVVYSTTAAGFICDESNGHIWALGPDGCLFREIQAQADAR
jgi:hypothetical protein